MRFDPSSRNLWTRMLAVCVAVGLLGCGSDDSGDTQATTPEPEVYEPGPVAESFEPQPVTLTWVFHDIGNPAVSGRVLRPTLGPYEIQTIQRN